jgi:hypothetical protein
VERGYARLPGFIGDLQRLKTLEVKGNGIKELPREIGALQQLRTLKISYTFIAELPREIQSLKKMETLDISYSMVKELPKEIWSLQQLNTLDITHTKITQLPKGIKKLQHLEHLFMSGTKVKIPREIGSLKELKSLKFGSNIAGLPLEVCHASRIVEFPQCIRQYLKKSDVLLSELADEMVCLESSGGLVVGARQMHIPPWISEHFNNVVSLDIRICKLEDQGLKILQEMPHLKGLTLRFQVVPREHVVISSRGFSKLTFLTIDSRVPRVIFQEGAMPMLFTLTFQFQFYVGPPNKDSIGINHLRSLHQIDFECSEDWYQGGDSPCIRETIDVVKKEAKELPSKITIYVCGRMKFVKGF